MAAGGLVLRSAHARRCRRTDPVPVSSWLIRNLQLPSFVGVAIEGEKYLHDSGEKISSLHCSDQKFLVETYFTYTTPEKPLNFRRAAESAVGPHLPLPLLPPRPQGSILYLN